MPTVKQKRAFEKSVENHGNITKAMRESGYSEMTLNNPSDLTESKGWKELMEEHLSQEKLAKKHDELLNATKLDHMVFPLGPKEEDKQPEIQDEVVNKLVLAQAELERTHLTDKDITQLLTDANCVVRKIVHGRTGRHVYFWATDNKARKDALDMAYKLRGSYAPEKSLNMNINANIMADEELVELASKLNEVARPPQTRESVSSDGADSNAVDAKE